MTTLRVYNWTGIDVWLDLSHAPNVSNDLIAPTGESNPSHNWFSSTIKHDNTRIDVRVMQGATNQDNGTTITYMVPTDAQAIGHMYFVSNIGFPAVSSLKEDDDDAYNAYTFTAGYDAANCYIVQGDYYSPASNYTFPPDVLVIEMPGGNYAGKTLVANAFSPTTGGSGGGGTTDTPSGGGGGGGTTPSNPDPCQSCTVCADCPNCSKCQTSPEKEDDGSTWYWWVLGVVVVILLLLLTTGAIVWSRRRRSREVEES